MWVRTASDVTTTQFLLEWVAQFSTPYPGMSLAIENGHFRVLLNPWVDVAPVQANTWYHLAVTKAAGGVTAYVNGQLVYSGTSANLGGQTSEIVLGASTFRGKKIYGEFFKGTIAQMCTWPVALDTRGVREVFRTDSALYIPPTVLSVGARKPTLNMTAVPNPFRVSSTIEFSLVRAGLVDLSVYSVDGRHLRTLARGNLSAGPHRFPWDGKSAGGHRVPAGVYFVRLISPEEPVVRRLVFFR